jgi:hypothetical protein
MAVTARTIDTAVARGIITAEQARAIAALAAEDVATPRFTFNHVLYYLGGMIAIGGVSFWVTAAWDVLGGAGIFLVALAGMALAAYLTEFFLRTQKQPIPAGLTAALLVALIPLAVYGLQRATGSWPEGNSTTYRDYHLKIDWRWIVMELATLAGGALVLKRWGLPFSVMPVAVTLWYMSMDIAPLIHRALGGLDPFATGVTPQDKQKVVASYWTIRQWTSVVIGLATTALAFVLDLAHARKDEPRDFAFWLYLAGVSAFWGGLTSMNSNSEVGRFIYFLINLAMIFLGAAISRRVFTVFGAMGVALYFGHLSYKVFKDSLLFPVVLTLMGLGVIWLGILWQRHEAAIGDRLRPLVPAPLRALSERT